MDFIMDFLITTTAGPKVNTILVVVDRLSKMAYFIPLWFREGKASTEVVTKFLFNHVFKLHGLPKEIVSDRDRRFTSGIARQLCRLAGIKQRISTTAHPETDG